MIGTLDGAWQSASDRVNDFGCRQRVRECWIDPMPLSPLHGGLDSRPPESVAPASAPNFDGCRQIMAFPASPQ